MRVLGRKKHMFFFGNARPKSNVRAHLKQRKKHSGLRPKKVCFWFQNQNMCDPNLFYWIFKKKKKS